MLASLHESHTLFTRLGESLAGFSYARKQEVVCMDYKCGRWLRLRAQALRRDHYECQWCAAEGKVVPATTVHHILPADEQPDKAYDLDNLVSLCRECHEAYHGRARQEDERFPEWW